MPEVEALTRAAKKAMSRRRILRAAKDVFFEDGFQAASLERVAAKAGVAKGTLYRHVDSKAELYVIVLLHDAEGFARGLESASTGENGAIESLRAIAEFYREYWLARPDYFRIFWAVRNQELIGEIPPPLRSRLAEVIGAPLRILQRTLERGIASGEIVECDSWVMANVLWRIGNACIEEHTAPESARIVDCAADQLFKVSLDLVLGGLSARPLSG